MNRRIAILLLTLVFIAPASPAGAVRAGDPDDMDGKLDISLTRFVEPEEDIGQLTIVTYESWGCAHLGRGRGTTLKWLIDGRGGRRFDLVGTFECRQRTLLFDLRSKDGRNKYEPIRVRRRGDRRTALVRFPLDLVEIRRDRITLLARSKDRSGKTCEGQCQDRAPDTRRLRSS
jgi:hypothetical protein